jgi:hypothetical protein
LLDRSSQELSAPWKGPSWCELSASGAGLSIGIPKNSVLDHETALKSDQFLLVFKVLPRKSRERRKFSGLKRPRRRLARVNGSLAQLSRIDVLVIDDWATTPLSEPER